MTDQKPQAEAPVADATPVEPQVDIQSEQPADSGAEAPLTGETPAEPQAENYSTPEAFVAKLSKLSAEVDAEKALRKKAEDDLTKARAELVASEKIFEKMLLSGYVHASADTGNNNAEKPSPKAPLFTPPIVPTSELNLF
jgi:hypothetical protein